MAKPMSDRQPSNAQRLDRRDAPLVAPIPSSGSKLFAIANVGFLTLDIYLAHSVNQFRNPAEYIPLCFSRPPLRLC